MLASAATDNENFHWALCAQITARNSEREPYGVRSFTVNTKRQSVYVCVVKIAAPTYFESRRSSDLHRCTILRQTSGKELRSDLFEVVQICTGISH
jgi:hypothetical protein